MSAKGPSAIRGFFAGKPRGRSPLEDIAAAYGLRFDEHGTGHSITQWPTLGEALVSAYGTVHETRNLAWGGHRGRLLAAFDLAEKVTPTDGSSYTNWYSCVLLVLEANLPRLTIDQENVLSRLIEKIPGAGDLKVGIEDFDDRFVVSAEPPAFAGEVLDPGMVQWLLGQRFPVRYELEGTMLTLKRDGLRGADARRHWETMIEMAVGFCDRIPAGVLDRYRDAERAADQDRTIARTFEVGPAPRIDPRSKGVLGAAAGVMKVAAPKPGVEPAAPRQVQERLLGIWGDGISTGADDEQIVVAWGARVAGEKKEYRYRALRITIDPTRHRAVGSLFRTETKDRLDPGEQLRRSSEWTFGPPMKDERYDVVEWLGEGGGAAGPTSFSAWALVEAVVEAVTGAGWSYKPKVVQGWPG